MKNLTNITIGSEVLIIIDGLQEQVSVINVTKNTIVVSRLVLSLNEQLKSFHEISTCVDGVYRGLFKQVLTFTKTGKLAHWHKKTGTTGSLLSIEIFN